MMWVKDLNCKYLYANKALCENLLMAKSLEEAIGKDDIFFANRERALHPDDKEWHTFGELCKNSDLEVLNSGKPMRFEEYGNVRGKLLYLEVFKAPFYDKEGNIIGTVGAGRDITELKQIQEELKYKSNYDLLTGVFNHDYFLSYIDKRLNRNDFEATVFLIDVDNFKIINDLYGHHIGDLVLKKLINRINKKINSTIKGKHPFIFSRYSGDEFLITVEGNCKADIFIKLLLSALKHPFYLDDINIGILNINIGVYRIEKEDVDVDIHSVLKNAEIAMYKAKRSNLDYVYFNDEFLSSLEHDIHFLEEFKSALLHNEFVIYFQPQFNYLTHNIECSEVLVRWEHPEKGIIPPGKFIPIAEKNNLIIDLDRIVLQQSIEFLEKCISDNIFIRKLSINLSSKHIESSDFIAYFDYIFKNKDYLIPLIEFEITETELMNDIEENIIKLNYLKELGFSISIDDFGTGYSSLSYLNKLPISKLKIDIEFIRNIHNSVEDNELIKIIIKLSNILNLDVLAEGVETVEQREFLLENNCYKVQGYLYSKPLPKEEFLNLIKSFQKDE